MTHTRALLFMLAVALLPVMGCSQLYNFSGVVVDGQGVGIDDADLLFYPYDHARPTQRSPNDPKTAKDGAFQATWCCAAGVKLFRLVTSRPGYEEDSRIVLANEKNLRVVLARARPEDKKQRPTRDDKTK